MKLCWCDGCQKEELDRLREELKRLKEEIKKIETSNELYKYSIGSLRKEKARLEATIRKLEKLATYYKGQSERLARSASDYAVFVRPHPGGQPDEIDILVGSELKKVALAVSGLTAKDLKCGWEVLINEKGNVAEVTKNYWTWGTTVSFKERLSEDTALVDGGMGEALQCFLSPELKGVPLKSGDSLLNCRGLLVKLFPKTEEADHLLDIEEINVGWSQIGGLSKAIKKIRRKILPFKDKEGYMKLFGGKSLPKGILLHGPEGCGKTQCAKAIATDLGKARGLKCYFMGVVGAELTNKYVGETARKLRELFARAEELAAQGALTLIFIDEFDSLFRSRDTAEQEPWMGTDIGQFNALLNGLQPLGNILVIGATNRKDLVDKAILRPGRMGIDIFIPRPRNEQDVKEILRIYLTANLPFAQKYYENDEYHYVDWFGSGQEARAALNKDPEKIREHFIEVITKRLLYDGPPIEITFEDDGLETVLVTNSFRAETREGEKEIILKNWLSGAILESIAENAKTIAFERYSNGKEAGLETKVEIKKKDFFLAIDEEVQRLKNNFRKANSKSIVGFK